VHTQVLCEHARGRQTITRLQRACLNQLADPIADLTKGGLWVASVDHKKQHRQCSDEVELVSTNIQKLALYNKPIVFALLWRELRDSYGLEVQVSTANEISLWEMGNWICPVRVGDSIALAPRERKNQGRIDTDELLEMDVSQTKYLAWLVEREEELELTTTAINAICFRYKPHRMFEMQDAEINGLNTDILRRLHISGIAARSTLDSENRVVMSAVGTSRETKTTDLEALIREVLYWGRCILGRKGGVSLGLSG